MCSEKLMTIRDETVIECKGLGKCFQIYDNPKARIKQAIWRGRRQYFREYWALRHVEFEVRRGESLGIIGRNGSGKSTLLQLICGTLTPTEGSITTNGRIAALLELGSGFNPEFTGLENIYLNASMLGISKENTDARLEDILAFADIGNFVHQPVKTYSSGMAVRLAFAVIAHVDADILVVDEALAVGDSVFVQRCMRFIRRMKEERCLLFVSHDSASVTSLCNKALWLLDGKPQRIGSCKEVTLDYFRYCRAASYSEEVQLESLNNQSSHNANNSQSANIDLTGTEKEFGRDLPDHSYEVQAEWKDNLSNANGWRTGDADLVEIRCQKTGETATQSVLSGGEQIEIIIRAKANKRINRPILGFLLRDRLGQDLFGENTLFAKGQGKIPSLSDGSVIEAKFTFWFPMLPAGEYTIMASIADGDLNDHIQHHWANDALIINVTSSRVRYGLVGVFISNISTTVEHRDEQQ
jgi:lipopolysaccharide transport system ATP-binding protein